MRAIFSAKNLLEKKLLVEVALAYGLASAGFITQEAAEQIERAASKVKLHDVEKLEEKLGHDVMALATILAESAGEHGGRVHLGATSYDIVDTAWALILRDALKVTKSKLIAVIEALATKAKEYENLLMPGRTHGQHALPITLGFKFANYAYELSRSLERILELEKRLIRGKMSGAVGTMAAWGDRGLVVEEETLKRLGLSPHAISTQVAPRDGFAEVVLDIAILGSQLDRFAIEVRELMRPEIGEVAEGTGERVGSSTMPQKRNPVTAEKISGLSKILRAFAITALENIPLWHERDLTNSSSERVMIPHVMLIIDEMLDSTISVLKNLRVDPDRMRRNLEVTGGAIMSEAVMVALAMKGLKRHEAHDLLRRIKERSERAGRGFREEVLEDGVVLKYLTKEEVEGLLRPENYIGKSPELISRALSYVENVVQACLSLEKLH